MRSDAPDVAERGFWFSYQGAYEKMPAGTSTASAPWYIISLDYKWFTRVAVADVIVAWQRALGLTYPQVSETQRALLVAEREQLVSESDATVKVANGQLHKTALGT